ncbi:MAG: hypothetical protein M3R50_04445 [Bacteroidota bacterium]|nr:hypothetical protein [Bacteroidota bacterium]
MSDEKAGNNFQWKNKLEDLESLPGEIFNKEATWDKLHERMQGNQSNKKFVWYWIAAACLFFALFISFFLSNKKENVLVKNNSAKNKLSASFTLPVITKDTVAIISSLPLEKKMPASPVENYTKINLFLAGKITKPKIVPDKKEEFVEHTMISTAAVSVDTLLSVVSNLPEKKKLKVVHINELGYPVSEPPVVARNTEYHSFQLKLLDQEIYTGSPSANTTRLKIFTTKNISPN